MFWAYNKIMKRFFGGESSPDSFTDPFYDAVPPGGEFVVHDGTALPPEPLHETPEEAIIRRESFGKAIAEVLRDADSHDKE